MMVAHPAGTEEDFFHQDPTRPPPGPPEEPLESFDVAFDLFSDFDPAGDT